MAAAPKAWTTRSVKIGRVEVDAGREQDARQGGKRGADDPGPPPYPRRVLSRHRDQVWVVDDSSHGHAHADETEEIVERPDQNERDDEDRRLVPAHVHPEEAVGLRGEVRGKRRCRGEPDLPEAENDQDDADGGGDLERVADVGQDQREPLERESRAPDPPRGGRRPWSGATASCAGRGGSRRQRPPDAATEPWAKLKMPEVL